MGAWCWAALAAGVMMACATPTPAAREADATPAGWDDARWCARTATWVDHIEGDWAVLVEGDAREREVAVRDLPAGVREGQAIVAGRVAPWCEQRVRAWVGSLRRAAAKSQDTDGVVRLE
ncbi:MAG: hypothetical protein U1F43_21980 [Myxococcota bacterium]